VQTAVYRLIDFCAGNFSERTLRRVFVPLILASYFGGLALAIWTYPGAFDWRTKSMSKLLYPTNNPQYHAIGSVGVAIAGLLTIPLAASVGKRLRVNSPAPAAVGALAFIVGAISLILCAVIVSSLHEGLARGAGIFFGLGTLAFYACVLRRRAPRRLFVAWSLIVPPALLVLALRLVAAIHFHSANPIYQTIENRALWHLGFWEWIGSAAVFLFLVCAAVFMPENE
jgi:hypothetical protein